MREIENEQKKQHKKLLLYMVIDQTLQYCKKKKNRKINANSATHIKKSQLKLFEYIC